MDNILGYACGIGAGDTGCADGPVYLSKQSSFKNMTMLHPLQLPDKYEVIAEICTRLAQATYKNVKDKQFFRVVGGEHSSAIGTWSGVAAALGEQNPVGLIWIDAHMDAHIPKTSSSGNIHGMPVAALLGYGDKRLTNIAGDFPKIHPENLCMIGIRSFEPSELDLLKQLKVKIYYMEEVKARTLDTVFREVHAIVTKNTAAYGISLDLDAIDPIQAPGVGTPENDGICADDLIRILKSHAVADKKSGQLVGFEIAEFNPHRDQNDKTLKLINKLLETL